MKKILKSLVMITVMALVLTAFTACELDLESIKDKVQSIIGGEQPVCVHEIVTDEAVDPTCTETGLTEGYHCGKCGEVILKQFTVKALGHKKGTPATCTEAAICSVCGEHYGDPAGHQFADATCSVPATCVVCGETEGEVNPDNHDFTDATCTDPQVCKDCGAEGEPALGHDYVDGYCTRCQAEQPAEETTVEIKVDTPYYISSAMSTGELYFSGSCTKGRLDGTNDIAKAVAVMLEAGETEGQYYIYFMNGEVKTYIALTGTKGTNRFSLTETKDATCLWTVDTTAKTIVSATTTDRGFATQVASTYYNFSTYSTQNLNSTDYDWSWFVPVE